MAKAHNETKYDERVCEKHGLTTFGKCLSWKYYQCIECIREQNKKCGKKRRQKIKEKKKKAGITETQFREQECPDHGVTTHEQSLTQSSYRCVKCKKEHRAKPETKASERRNQDKHKLKLTAKESDIAADQRVNGKCTWCKRGALECGESLTVDHDWDTGVIRGTLCNECNMMEGWIKKQEKTSGSKWTNMFGSDFIDMVDDYRKDPVGIAGISLAPRP